MKEPKIKSGVGVAPIRHTLPYVVLRTFRTIPTYVVGDVFHPVEEPYDATSGGVHLMNPVGPHVLELFEESSTRWCSCSHVAVFHERHLGGVLGAYAGAPK